MGELQKELFIQSNTPITIGTVKLTSISTDIIENSSGPTWKLSLWAMTTPNFKTGLYVLFAKPAYYLLLFNNFKYLVLYFSYLCIKSYVYIKK